MKDIKVTLCCDCCPQREVLDDTATMPEGWNVLIGQLRIDICPTCSDGLFQELHSDGEARIVLMDEHRGRDIAKLRTGTTT